MPAQSPGFGLHPIARHILASHRLTDPCTHTAEQAADGIFDRPASAMGVEKSRI